MKNGIRWIAIVTACAALALSACSTDNSDETTTEKENTTDADKDSATDTDGEDLIENFENLGCAANDGTGDALVAGDPPVESSCIAWTLDDSGILTVECMNLVSECGGAPHAAAYQTGDTVVFRTHKDPAATGECDTAACVCPNHFAFAAKISVPSNGLSLIIESGGCMGEKEEELAHIEIPEGEVAGGTRCDF